MARLRNEYRALEERDGVLDMSLSNLIREYAQLKVYFAISETDPGRGWHNRLTEVVTEIRARGYLND